MEISFVVTLKNGEEFIYSTCYDWDDEDQMEYAWDEVDHEYPDAKDIRLCNV